MLKSILIFIQVLFSNFYKTSKIPDYFVCKQSPKWAYSKLLKKIFYKNMGYKLNLYNPSTFNEKIQYLKLFDNIPIKSTYTDKIAVRDFAEKIVGKTHLKRIYKVYNEFSEINIDELPETFYLKANHGCKMQYYIPSKAYFKENYDELKSHFSKWCKMDFAFVNGFELQYSPIQPKIFAEEYIKNPESEFPVDIEIFCFDGKPKLISLREIYVQTSYSVSLYTVDDLKLLPYNFNVPGKFRSNRVIPLPDCMPELLSAAEKFSSGFKLVRVDFAYTTNNYYFGELTFTPYSGFYSMPDKELDIMLCSWLKL